MLLGKKIEKGNRIEWDGIGGGGNAGGRKGMVMSDKDSNAREEKR